MALSNMDGLHVFLVAKEQVGFTSVATMLGT